jgi:SWI/SNF-related matrix-associated actin-dependent regulator of chromatin subfamily B protein 1
MGQVDILVGTQNLTDSFEWDLNSNVSPEEFAASHVKELGLSGEFASVFFRAL